METWLIAVVAVLFVAVFAGVWVGVSALIGLVSGWYGLARRFPDRDEPALIRLDGCTGFMGAGANLKGVLTLSACASGLRVAIWRGLGLFSRPFFVPWDQVAVSRRKVLFGELARLEFGRPPAGNLSLYPKTWARLSPPAG